MGKLADEYFDKIDIMIDHHSRGDVYADNYIDPEAAATGEIIFDISREFLRRGLIKSIPERFDLLAYIAIATDTGCFKYSNTTPSTHKRIAELMTSFDYGDVNYRIFDSKTPDELKITRFAIENIASFNDGAVSVATLDYEEKKALDVPEEYLDILINIARSVYGTKVAVSVKQTAPDDTYKVSLRSNCDIDVSLICAKFGGGGHSKASGCTLHAPNMSEAVRMIVEEIQKAL
jgi:phosphoesterase RecJ-like protein